MLWIACIWLLVSGVSICLNGGPTFGVFLSGVGTYLSEWWSHICRALNSLSDQLCPWCTATLSLHLRPLWPANVLPFFTCSWSKMFCLFTYSWSPMFWFFSHNFGKCLFKYETELWSWSLRWAKNVDFCTFLVSFLLSWKRLCFSFL